MNSVPPDAFILINCWIEPFFRKSLSALLNASLKIFQVSSSLMFLLIVVMTDLIFLFPSSEVLFRSSLMRLNSWLLLFQTSGPVNNFLQNAGFIDVPINFVYTDGLVMLGMITNMLPFAVLPMYSSIEKLSKSLLEASADLGASRGTTFFNITLPLTFPGIFSSIILVFIPTLGIYTVTDMLGGGKILYIGNIIKNQFGAIRNWPLGAALSVLLIVITGLLIFIYTRFAKIEDMEVL